MPPPSANGPPPPQFAAYPQGKTHILILLVNCKHLKHRTLDLQF
jgi:hypothetical protein